MFSFGLRSAQAIDDCSSKYAGTCTSGSCASPQTALAGEHCSPATETCCYTAGNSTATATATAAASSNSNFSLGGWADKAGGVLLYGPLMAILGFFSLLLGVATTIFAWAIDTATFSKAINVSSSGVIYSTWMFIRDTVDVAFILFLLYAAFSIIFQVGGKFGEKKILLKIVLMALLVNFSFPITLFIIDVSNSLMYTIFQSPTLFDNSTGGVAGAFTFVANNSGLSGILASTKIVGLTELIASIIFSAILALTFLSMAILFVIRLAALSIIIIFSPIAFVGSVAGKDFGWWDYLFKYAFFGPVMAFFLAVSLKLMTALQITGTNLNDPIIASMAKFAAPVIILWMGMGMAQKMGVETAGIADKGARWAGKAVTNATGVPGGFKKAADYYGKKGAPGFLGKIPGLRGSEKTEDLEAGISGFLTKGNKGYKTSQEAAKRKRIAARQAARQKEFEDERLTVSEAKIKMDGKDETEKMAAALYLSKKDKINDSATFASAMKALRGDEKLPITEDNEELQKELLGKTRKDNDVKFVIDYDVRVNNMSETAAYEKNLGNLSPENLAKQKGLHDNIGGTDADAAALRSFVKKNIQNNVASHQKFFSELSTNQQQAYKAQGLEPSAPAQQTNQQAGQNSYKNKNRRRPQAPPTP